MKKPSKGDKQNQHPILDAAEVGEQETRELFREVSTLVRYADFTEYPWERFRGYKRLAMLDLWSEAPDEEKVSRAELAPEELVLARNAELYARLKFALTEAFREVSSPRKAAEWVAAMEDASFRRLARIARHALDPRLAAAAARDFADRALPKVSRNTEETGAPVLMITEDGARLLMAALETVQRKTPQLVASSPESE